MYIHTDIVTEQLFGGDRTVEVGSNTLNVWACYHCAVMLNECTVVLSSYIQHTVALLTCSAPVMQYSVALLINILPVLYYPTMEKRRGAACIPPNHPRASIYLIGQPRTSFLGGWTCLKYKEVQ